MLNKLHIYGYQLLNVQDTTFPVNNLETGLCNHILLKHKPGGCHPHQRNVIHLLFLPIFTEFFDITTHPYNRVLRCAQLVWFLQPHIIIIDVSWCWRNHEHHIIHHRMKVSYLIIHTCFTSLTTANINRRGKLGCI